MKSLFSLFGLVFAGAEVIVCASILVCLAAHVTNGWKSLIRPSSGKDTAKDKGVHREVESEGSRMANLWSDEQKSHQAMVKDKVAKQTKVQ